MTINIMVDLETMGNRSNAVIASIGAVKFTQADGVVDTFYRVVDMEDCVANGLTMDVSTIKWWINQERAAKVEILKPGVKLLAALLDFSQWVGDDRPALVWGNGATFDNVILNNAYKAINLAAPWSFRNDRCYRTVRNLLPMGVELPVPANKGVAHNALDDAIYQTEVLLAVAKHLNLTLM